MGMEDEAEVEALLKQIALAKQKELRLRVEKKRIRDELGQLQTGTLWSREEQTQKHLLEVRRAKEQLEAQKKVEEEKLAKLSDSLKEQELKFRKGIQAKSSPFQQAAASVVATAPKVPENSSQNENARTLGQTKGAIPDRRTAQATTAPPSPPARSTDGIRALVSNQEASTQELDELQRLIRNINCDEQQKRVERLQAELDKASSRRREVDFDMTSAGVVDRSSIASDDSSRSPEHEHSGIRLSRSPPGSQTQGNRQIAAARKAAKKSIHLKPLKGHLSGAKVSPDNITDPEENVPVPTTQPPAIPTAQNPVYSPQFVVPGYYQSYPAPIVPYPMLAPPITPVNPYGVSFPSPYFSGCSYPATQPWAPSGAAYPYQIGVVPSPEQSLKPAFRHQEEKIHRLERELEMQRIANEQQAEEKEFAQLQGRLQELQSKISTLTVPENPLVTSIHESDDDKGDSTLKSLKRQHLESLAKVRNERDLLEEQEKLEELKESIQRRREEKKRELDHEDWVTKQKRELVALRLQRAIQHEDMRSDEPPADYQGGSPEPYKPDNGFVLFWDYVAGVPAAGNDIQITYAVYEGKMIRTPFKVVSAKETNTIGPQQKLCMLLSSRQVKKLPAASDVRAIIEVATVSQSGAGGPRIPTSLGWTAFDIFKLPSEGELTLACGYFKLPVKQSTMPDPSKTLVLPPTIGDCGEMRIHMRLVQGGRADEASRLPVNPELHAARYQLPDASKTSLPRPQSKGNMSRRPSLQGRRSPNDNSAPTKPLDDRKTISSPSSVEPFSDSPQKQDFLDVDRLRLLSSTSSRPPSNRPRSDISTTGERPRLPPFREDSAAETDEPWIRVDKTLELQRRLLTGSPFQPGDGFNVYIDGGRGFPDCVTISKVTIAALHADRTQVVVENGSAFASAVSDAFDPTFDAYVEYRQSSFNPTLTLIIRVDTVELVSKRPVILGYSVFPVFLDVETRDQPNRPSIPQFILNEGGFQLPLHAQIQPPDASQPLSAKSCEEFPRIPCATVLLRIVRAKLSGDGLALLARKDFPPHEWEAKGLIVPAPQYFDHFYDSLRCVPSGIEEKIYSTRHKRRRPKTVALCFQQMSLSTSEARDMLKTKPPNYLDLTSALRYEPAIGFRVAVDALSNVKAKGAPFFKVLFSVYPPGSFYQAIRLTGDVYFTTTMDWTSAQTSPEFTDGYMTLRDSASDPLLAVLFDVRSVARHPKTGAITSQQYGWTFLPVLANSRSVGTCSIQLPLFQGEVNLGVLKAAVGGLSTLVDDIGSGKVKQLVPVAEEGASVFVRLQDPQPPHLVSQPIVSASLSKMIPSRLSAKYANDKVKVAALKKKNPLSKLLPANVPDQQFEKETNQAFAQEMGIHHLLF
ncbi:hypothetical protein KRP22_008428 [Phytophthora ramorum]|uniref:uncharacterized protein n=1 Tax=Phytophthora ramorum TaxID=164328 RepID=UPI0030AAEEC0|nr:hypothetical protein KRP23_14686 [Phytophthora ramorum]KAH7494982.1 hypothetical protein KRP22_15179 [Phytophthora ramorum]